MPVSEKKEAFALSLREKLISNSSIILSSVDHVGSSQFQHVRKDLKDDALIIMGKNTTLRAILKKDPTLCKKYENLLPLMKGNIAYVICKKDPAIVRKKIMENKVPAPARQGVLAPIDVHVEPGPTGMDPSQTSFFQVMNISTKIVKGQIEIQSPVHIIKKDEKVTANAAALLQKLNRTPFHYGLKPLLIYEDGDTYPADALEIDESHIKAMLSSAAADVAAIGLATGIPNTASVAHSLTHALVTVAALCLGSDYKCDFVENLKSGAGSSTNETKTDTKASEPTPAPKEESESDGDIGFSLFD